MTPQDFVAKWQRANLSERAASHEHFLDLCRLLHQPTPAEDDPDGASYTFERGVSKMGGGNGWADVWKRGYFGWEYKGKHKDLVAAYSQLQLYREDLENPPLLVVCDLDRFEIHTNFTGTITKVYAFDLAGLAKPQNLDTLRKLFTDPEALRPGITTASVTEQAAEKFGMLADGLRVRGVEAHAAAHFLMKLMFCMFAEDVGLLPEKLFGNLLKTSKTDPKRLSARLEKLFEAMATGGDFGAVEVPFFNGGLFADHEVIELQWREIETLVEVNERDWSNVEPSVFGTLFERTLDPAKRSQIGAHYTSREEIETLLEPVVMTPLRREWDAVRETCDALWEKIKTGDRRSGRGLTRSAANPGASSPAGKKHDRALQDFVERLAHVTILDPACGSGNFLYVAIHLLLDLEKQVIAYAATHGLTLLPQVRPTQLARIEINPYAQQLAQVVIWIAYLQWKYQNGFQAPRNPVLEPIESIREMDAILDLSDPAHPKEPEWPNADFIVGNGGAGVGSAPLGLAESARMDAGGGFGIPRLGRWPLAAIYSRSGPARHRHGPVCPPRGQRRRDGQAPRQAHAHQSLQRAPHVARPRPPPPRRSRLRRLRLGPLHDGRPTSRKTPRAQPRTRRGGIVFSPPVAIAVGSRCHQLFDILV